MRTVEEFAKIVKEENNKHNEELLNLNPAMLIDRAWEIAKWQSIYDYIEGKVIPYLKDEEDMCEGFLTLEIDCPIRTMYEFEFEYDEPQWANWNNLDDMVCEMFRTIKNHN